MSYFDSDPFLPKGTSIEDLRQYTEVLLGAAELAEAIVSYPEKACDRHYRISDPRTTELIDVPEAAYDIVGYDNRLESVTFHSTMHHVDGQTFVSSAIGLEFSDNNDLLIDMIDEQPYIVSKDENRPPMAIATKEVSNIIARAMYPSNDPIFSDFSNINDPERVKEICETLDSCQFVASSKEEIFQIDDEYQIIAETKDGKLTACEIVEFRDEEVQPVSLTVKFNHFATASELYRSTPDGSEELIMDAGDLDRFLGIIERIKERLAIQATTSFKEDI